MKPADALLMVDRAQPIKSASAGLSMLKPASAATALAVRLSQSPGLTFLGFARGQNMAVYADAGRLVAAMSTVFPARAMT